VQIFASNAKKINIMNTEIAFLSKLMEGVKIKKGELVRILYSGVLNKYENLSNPPKISVDSMQNYHNFDNKYAKIVEDNCIIVWLFRKSAQIWFSWNPETRELKRYDPPIPTLDEWIQKHIMMYRTIDWSVFMEEMRQQPEKHLTFALKGVRSTARRSDALYKVENNMLMAVHLSDENYVREAKLVLSFLFARETEFGRNPRNFLWYTIEQKASAEVENDQERDIFVTRFRKIYDDVKIECISNLLISVGTDLWDEFGYQYPPFFTECGKPVNSRYKTFLEYVESTRKVVIKEK
jgi:hypothetical protein